MSIRTCPQCGRLSLEEDLQRREWRCTVRPCNYQEPADHEGARDGTICTQAEQRSQRNDVFDDGPISAVRGVCAFCADWNHFREHPPCVNCYGDPLKPLWSPSRTGDVALRLETELSIAEAKLARVQAALNGEPDTYGIATDGEYDAETPVGDSTHNTPTPDPRPRLTPFAIDALRGRERYGTNDYDGTLHCHDGCYRQLRAHREDPEVPTDG